MPVLIRTKHGMIDLNFLIPLFKKGPVAESVRSALSTS
ncbi:hypothetical protein JOC54_001153 [Alkalihalobacillus xiaoxiensis]|uniref:Transposase n=1 Tax=Shouchella xiaoxiensis TaxID=766895 RepID=A0ABS2SQX4_9BACI|nr:hypothetical protein [Shouchella xiaoxiensis]